MFKKQYAVWEAKVYGLADQTGMSHRNFKSFMHLMKEGVGSGATKENCNVTKIPETLQHVKERVCKEATTGLDASTGMERIEIPTRSVESSEDSCPLFTRDAMEVLVELLHNVERNQDDVQLIPKQEDSYSCQMDSNAALEQYGNVCHKLGASDDGMVLCDDGIERKVQMVGVNICIDKSARKNLREQTLYPVELFLANSSNKARHQKWSTQTVAMLSEPTALRAPQGVESKTKKPQSKTMQFEKYLYLHNAMRLILTPYLRMAEKGAIVEAPAHWTVSSHEFEHGFLLVPVISCFLVDNQEGDVHTLVYPNAHADRVFHGLPTDEYIGPDKLGQDDEYLQRTMASWIFICCAFLCVVI